MSAALSKSLDISAYIGSQSPEAHHIHLSVDGMHCVACAFSIEAMLNAQAGVRGRVNVTDKRLDLNWTGPADRGNALVQDIQALGYEVRPLTKANTDLAAQAEETALFRALCVAGFGAANIMLLSFALWFSGRDTMGGATRDLFHWLSALIALPCVIYAGQPFFQSAWSVLRHGRTNMDVPISLAIVLASCVSLFETLTHGVHAYFDSAVMLLFLLLIGRWLDRRARGRARGAAQDLLLMMNSTADIVEADRIRTIPLEQVSAGMLLHVPAGARIGADGLIESGDTLIDSSLISGETLPQARHVGDAVFAGALNLDSPIRVRAQKSTAQTLLSDIIQLMQQAEQRQSHYVRLADRIARAYTPVVHALAAASFLGWWWGMGASWQQALMVATTVLIITCPCALALAIPAVQVAASSALFRRGILLKSADALERLAQIDTVFFDKTGTLTRGTPEWRDDPWLGAEDRQAAAQLAAHSHHVLAKALSRAIGAPARTFDNIQEIPGLGIEAMVNGVRWRLGRRTWCGDGTASGDEMELWFQRSDAKPIRFAFHDALRPDARAAVAAVRAMGLSVALLSGDRDHVARSVGNLVGIENVAADLLPRDKVMRLEAALASGHRALMVGDGLNDAPALTAAHASMSPSSGIDIAQNAADLVFQGAGLHAVPLALATARKARHLVRQNLAAAIGYNLCALPIAISGQVTPLIAALAMSSSSLIVILNALRAGKLDAEPTDQALPLPTRARLKEKLA